jgi:programmed cell death 6-interacting protein
LTKLPTDVSHARFLLTPRFDPWQIQLGISYAPIFQSSAVPVTLKNLAFERCGVLFNLAALYSQLAEKEDRQTKERIKKARVYYQVREPPPVKALHLKLTSF